MNYYAIMYLDLIDAQDEPYISKYFSNYKVLVPLLKRMWIPTEERRLSMISTCTIVGLRMQKFIEQGLP
jgi:hypothetical protein